jgi:hypothetical protein
LDKELHDLQLHLIDRLQLQYARSIPLDNLVNPSCPHTRRQDSTGDDSNKLTQSLGFELLRKQGRPDGVCGGRGGRGELGGEECECGGAIPAVRVEEGAHVGHGELIEELQDAWYQYRLNWQCWESTHSID